MGNNGSRSGNVTHPRQSIEPEQQWAHSFPRNPPRINQHKVLPERQIDRKLRSTNNGEILQSGGTLTGRSYQQTLSLEREEKSFRIFRANSISPNSIDEFVQKETSRSHVPRHRGVNRYVAQRCENKNNLYKEQVKRFGSEPDLRNSQIRRDGATDKFKGKQKYKAPSPPNNSMQQQPSLSSYKWDETNLNEPIGMRARLFKTNAELKKKYSSPIKNKQIIELENYPNVEFRNKNNQDNYKNNRYSLPELEKTTNVTEFKAELKEVVEKMTNKNEDPKEKLKTLDHNIKNKFKQIEQDIVEKEKFYLFDNRGQPSGKESTPEKTPSLTELEKKDQPSKLFYFGMTGSMKENQLENLNYPDNSIVDNFAAKLHSYNRSYQIPNSSGSDLSSELEIDESQISTNGIALQLRPILPKKQLEIPRFSPAAAWKLLSSIELDVTESVETNEEAPSFLEERIEKLSRPPPPPAIQAAPRSTHDKSGDSGISGDAGPVCFEDCPESNLHLPPILNRSGISWTPQQDLGEEESSTDDELQEDRLPTSTVKFVPKPNVFSLSLPRDNYLSSYKNGQSYMGLQKLKRSVSGVLGSLSKRDTISSNCREQNENWFLSKSAPNSLNNGFNSLESAQKLEEVGRNTQNVSRVMYLPELDKLYVKNHSHQRKIERCKKDALGERSKSVERLQETFKLNQTSKSYENISGERCSSSEPEDLQDPPKKPEIKIHKPKRFTFQSTIRQIERRRLAEKLSREAERKEKQRLSELQAMQRVEEEFQRKRAREKASIRQQLRLFTLDETTWTSLPPNLEIQKDVPIRSDPDGAVSSLNSSPILSANNMKKYEQPRRKLTPVSDSDESTKKATMTQILSEYRQPQRDYKDFRGSPSGYRNKFNDSQSYRQTTTVHPQVTCDMPKASAHKETRGSSNYRKQFAHGVKSNNNNKSGGSTYSDDSQTNNYSPKAYRNKKATITRF